MKKILLSLSLLSSLAFSADECIGFLTAGNPQKATVCYSKQIKKDNSFNNNYLLAVSYLKQSRFKEALPYLVKAEELAKNTSDIVFVYNRLSVVYSALGNNDLELIYAMKVLDYYLKVDNRKEIATAYVNLASYYDNKGNNDKALEFLNKSLEYDNTDPITYNNFANIYNNLEQYDKAKEYLIIAISKAETKGDISLLCSLKSNLGVLNYFSSNYVDAQKILLESNSICIKLNVLDSIANSYIYLGFISLKLNDIESAKNYYKKAEPLVNQIGEKGIYADLVDLKSELDKKD